MQPYASCSNSFEIGSSLIRAVQMKAIKLEDVAESEPVPYPMARTNPFDPPSEFSWFREHQPLRRLSYPDGHLGWLVTSCALARTILADARFSSRSELIRQPRSHHIGDTLMGKPAPPAFLLGIDPPDHTRLRRLLLGRFSGQRMNELRPQIEQIVASQLNAMQRSGPPVDLLEGYALPIPSLAVSALLGVPPSDRATFERSAAVLMHLESTPEQTAAANQEILSYLRELAQHKRLHRSDDLLGFCWGLVEGGQLTEDELLSIAFQMLIAGHETSAAMIALGAFALLCHPDQRERLLADPQLIRNAVEELVRYLSIGDLGINRTALENVELAGRLIKAGDSVTISVAAANRDPVVFENPDRLDLTRKVSGHMGFGHGVHACIGQHLARLEMQIAYPALFGKFPTLRLAVPQEDIPLRNDSSVFRVHRLPVAW
ncbi:MAG: cytochrome P450 [Steroidobacteraceae bacterium]